MADSQIRVRFASTGLKQMRDDLKAAGLEGDSAFRKIDDSIAKPNKALGLTLRELEMVRTAGQAAGRETEVAFRKVDAVVTRLNPSMSALRSRVVVGDQSSIQAQINAATGVTGTTYSASVASAVFLEQEKRAQALREALNPTIAAERKFSAAVGEASTLLAAGAITEAEHTAAVALARKEFSAAEKAVVGLAGGVSLNRAQMMELGHVARSAADGLAAGQNPMRILAMEGGRVTQALGEGEGGVAGALGAIGRLIVSPIGLIVTFVAVLAMAAKAAMDFAGGQNALAREVVGSGVAFGSSVDQLNAAAEAGQTRPTSA